ncbi:hypothetical protein PHYC_01156 [Phycisphaerales bacterium]|nr:hypothetical protein PHYC_01156 [Phycisphaerales bacterium]
MLVPSAPAKPDGPADADDFVERARASNAQVVAVTYDQFLGVSSSTANLFEHCYYLSERSGLGNEDLARHARSLLATRASHFVFSGGNEYQHSLMQTVKSINPGVRCDLFLHASYPQFAEPYSWKVFNLWLESARRGEVYSIASAKLGFDRFVRSLGLRGHVLLNRINAKLLPCPELPDAPRHIGLWLSGTTYRKIPHAMIAAMSLIPDVRLHAAGLHQQAIEVIRTFGIPEENVESAQIPHADVLRRMRTTHLTIYVTFIECCPMIPLESLHQGVPALIGPNSHLFRDNPFLFERLVVPFPDHAEVIADYAERAIRERSAIVAEYQRYYPEYEQRSRQSFDAFVNS